MQDAVELVRPARLQVAFLDPELRGDLAFVAPHLLDEALASSLWMNTPSIARARTCAREKAWA